MAVVLEVPVRVRGEPVVAIAVEHDRVVVRDAAVAHQRPELLRPEEIALHRVLKVLLPVEPDGPGNVSLGVESRVLVDLYDANRWVVEVVLNPLRLYQDILCVVGHTRSSSTPQSGLC